MHSSTRDAQPAATLHCHFYLIHGYFSLTIRTRQLRFRARAAGAVFTATAASRIRRNIAPGDRSMDKDDDGPRQGAALPPLSHEAEIEAVQKRLTLFASYGAVANLLGLLGAVGVWRLFSGQDGIQEVMMISAMVFALGLAAAVGSYAIFRGSTALSRDADAIHREAGDDETALAAARERQTEAFGRMQSGMKILKMSGVCFVASALIAITGLFSV